ncbi:MAG: hypothetical protein Q8R25_03125 [bacterium]|nr:hypothetical protein [bacterium]
MRRFLHIAPLLIATVPAVAFAAAPRTFQELANTLVILMNNAVVVLVVLGLVVYFYGISINILKMKDEGGEKVKAYFFWGVIVLFVMVSVWGILQILQKSLFGGDQFNVGAGAEQQDTNSFTPPVFTE